MGMMGYYYPIKARLQVHPCLKFRVSDALPGSHGSGIHYLGLGICFNEYNYHDSLQARLIEGIAHFLELIYHLYVTPRVP